MGINEELPQFLHEWTCVSGQKSGEINLEFSGIQALFKGLFEGRDDKVDQELIFVSQIINNFSVDPRIDNSQVNLVKCEMEAKNVLERQSKAP